MAVAVATLVAAGLSSFFGHSLVSESEQAISIVVTVFAILAGFIISAITFTGDAAVMLRGSWRAVEMARPELRLRLVRYRLLVACYALVLGLIFVAALLQGLNPRLLRWVEISYVFLAIVGFAGSLWLPFSLIRIQQDRIDAAIEDRRAHAGIRPVPASTKSRRPSVRS